MKFSGRVAIVTAAAGAGIGQGVARALANEGANVLVSDAHAKRPLALAEEIQSTYGVKALGCQCDVTNRQQVDRMVKLALDEFGQVDILVNNAGTARSAPITEVTDEDWDLVVNVCLRSAFYCSRAVLPGMIARKRGRIVSISSVAAFIGSDEGVAYCAAKYGVIGFTRRLAREVGPYNITANAIAPGLIMNPFLAKTPGLPADHFDNIRKELVVGRDGKPDDITNAVMFLCSDESGYLTGQTLSVSGGWYML